MKKKTILKPLMLFIDFVIAALLVGIDQWTKLLAIRHLKDRDAFVLVPDVLELDYLENRGSAFGILQDQKVFILFVCIVFLAVVMFFLIKLPNDRKFVAAHVFLSMIVAGGVGNIIDRVRFDYVVDFISFVLIHFPIFNFADICVVISVIALFILFLFVYKEQDLEFLSFKRSRYREID